MLEKIMLPHDKANHAFYGALVAAVGTVVHSWQAGAIACVAVGVGYELYQRLKTKGHPSIADAAATIAGGALVVVPWVVHFGA